MRGSGMIASMSDLQCPAILVLLTPETVVGREFAERRLARIFIAASISIGTGAVVEANRLAAIHGCRVEGTAVADGSELLQRIEEIADGYRGETVALVAPSGVLCDALEWADAPTEPVALALDASGSHVVAT
jgi:hypothetical protein